MTTSPKQRTTSSRLVSLLAFLILLCSIPLFSNGQSQKIKLANETIVLDKSDSIISHKGNTFSGEIRYKSRRSETIIDYAGGSKTRVIVYSTDGIKLSEYHFKEGKVHGPFGEWNSYGKPKMSGSYHENQQDGSWSYHYSNGVVRMEGAYVADSTKALNDFFINHVITSTEPPYDQYDSISVYHNHSAPHGPWYIYDRKGKLITSFDFNYGVIQGMMIREGDDE
jgi:antitoxin component YwqK of YwqJK toxin-antitoxin module